MKTLPKPTAYGWALLGVLTLAIAFILFSALVMPTWRAANDLEIERIEAGYDL